MPSGAPLARETAAKASAMIASCIQTVSASPQNFPIRNSERESGFERIV